MTDQAPELVVDKEFKSPKPLDRRIASVLLRTPTNNPTDGYELMLSATFGQERVILKADDFEIDVAFSITSADIELEFIRCAYSLLDSDQGSRAEDWKTTIKEQFGLRKNATARIGAALTGTIAGAVSGEVGAGGQYRNAATSSTSTQRKIVQHDWYRLDGEAIKIGRTGKMLDGPIITDFSGWRVRPSQTNEVSAVIARVKVRENWIKFDDVQYRKTPPSLLQKVTNLLNPSNRKRREHFQLLLRHLAQTQLREQQEDREATIAAHVLVVRPFEEHATALPTGERRREIEIDRKMLADFLSSEVGHEASALIALGVGRELIPSDLEEQKRKRGTRRMFVPDSSPIHAAALFKQIHDHKRLSKSDLVHPTSLHDLRALNLVTSGRSETVQSKANAGIDSDDIFRRAVSEMPCIKVARAVLRISPNASPTAIADAVALELGKDWPTQGTKKRNGSAIKRWTIWLEPHLLDPVSSGEAAMLVAYAKDKTVMKGRPPSLRKALEPELRQMIADGESVAVIAAHFKVSKATIYIWIKKLGLRRAMRSLRVKTSPTAHYSEPFKFPHPLSRNRVMSKIEYHYQTVGRILVYLVEQGLGRVDLEAADAMDIMTERHGDEEEVLAAFADCLHWMINEGLIHVTGIQEFDGGYAFAGVQLTSSGIAITKADPHDNEIGTSIQARVAKAPGEPMDTGLYTKIGEFVGSALGGFTKSMSGG